jgi:hypothetical protein|tara:strand:+ start:969 stop:1154 length:186 start_codon:yes stop_codon:yes gene_type:complete
MLKIIHWLGFIISVSLAGFLISLEGASTNPLWLNFVIIVVPNTIGWVIKFIFTGNGRYFPF